jgi:hypothetical protein
MSVTVGVLGATVLDDMESPDEPPPQPANKRLDRIAGIARIGPSEARRALNRGWCGLEEYPPTVVPCRIKFEICSIQLSV